MKKKPKIPKLDPYTIKAVAAVVLIVLVIAAMLIAAQKAREPQLIIGRAESYTLMLEDMEEGFTLAESSRVGHKSADGWKKGYTKIEDEVRINIHSSVFIHASLSDADSAYEGYVDSVINIEQLPEIPFEKFGEKSFFYSTERALGGEEVPYFELFFKKINTVTYLELFIEDQDFNNTDWAHDTIRRYAEIMEEKINS